MTIKLRWPWVGDDAAPDPAKSESKFRIDFKEPAEPADDEEFSEDWGVEMTVPLRHVSALFAERGWALSRPGTGPQPSPQELAALITESIMAVADHETGSYFNMGRFLTLADTDFPEDVDIYLHIGTATRRQPVEVEETEGDELD